MRLVSFKEESGLFSYGRHYYQQRFNFIEPQDDLTLAEFLRAGTSATDDDLSAAAERLGVGNLLPLSLIKLSNGQLRRARLAHALLAKPELLILDEPFLGLDVAGREDVAALLGNLLRGGLRVVLIMRPDIIPEWVTHVLVMDRLTAAWQGRRDRFLSSSPARSASEGCEPDPSRSPARSASEGCEPDPSLALRAGEVADPIIELRHVNVAYGDRPICATSPGPPAPANGGPYSARTAPGRRRF